MVVVRNYGLPEVEAKPVPSGFQGVAAAGDVGLFGGNQARDLQVAGTQLAQASDNTFSIYALKAKEANDTKVDADMNSFIDQKQKTIVAFSQLKGEDAIKGAQGATDSLLAQKKALLESAANDYQKNALSKRLDLHLLDATGSISQHVAKEASAFKVDTLTAKGNLVIREGLTKQDDPLAIERQLVVMADIGNDLAKAKSGAEPGSDIAKDYVARAQSGYVTAIIKSKIASGDISASTFYDKYKDKIDPEARPPIEAAIDTLKTNKDAQGWAQTRAGGGGAGDAWKTSPDYITRVTGHEGGTKDGGMVPNALGSDAFGPGQITEGTWNDIRKAHPELNLPADRTTATREQHIAATTALTVDNAAALQAAGHPVTPANLYLAHRFGAAGASSVLKANATTPLANILPAGWFTKNPDMQGKTAGSFIQLAQARMEGVTQIPGVTNVPAPSNLGDPLAGQVNAATAGRPAPSLEGAVAGATAPPVADPAQGVPNVRQQLIRIEGIRNDGLAAIESDFAAGKIDDKTRRARTAEINSQFEMQKQGTELYKNQLWDQINRHMMTGNNGGPAITMPNANLTSQLDPKDVVALQTMVDHNIAGTKIKTNWDIYSNLRTALTSRDRDTQEKTAALNPMQFRPHLSDDDYKTIIGMQEAVRKGDPDGHITHAQTLGRKITERLGSIEVKTGEKANAADRAKEIAFTEEAERRVADLEKSKGGKKALPGEIDQILREMTYEVTGSGGWFDWGKKRAYEVPNADPKNFVVKIESIPKPDIEKIRQALAAEGIPPTDDNVIARYKIVRLGAKP